MRSITMRNVTLGNITLGSAPWRLRFTSVLSPAGASRATLLISGLFAWLATVVLPCLHLSANVWVRPVCAITPLPLVLGSLLGRASVGRAAGIWGFVSLSLTSWALGGGKAVELTVAEPIRGFIGALAWGFFALAWGSERGLPPGSRNDLPAPSAPPLQPRERLRFAGRLGFYLSLGSAVLLALLAWGESRPTHSLLAHASALAAGMALLHVGARFATSPVRPAARDLPFRARLARGAVPLGAALFLSLLGLVVWLA